MALLYEHFDDSDCEHDWKKDPASWGADCRLCGQKGFVFPTMEGEIIIPVDESSGDEEM